MTDDLVTEWRLKYERHKAGAAARGIEFLFTFQQWLDAWGEQISDRGRGKDALAMCRFGDRGPYAAGNVYIATNSQNGHDVKLHNRYNRPRGSRDTTTYSQKFCGEMSPGSLALCANPDTLIDQLRIERERQRRAECDMVAHEKREAKSPKVKVAKVVPETPEAPRRVLYSTKREEYEAIAQGRKFSRLRSAKQTGARPAESHRSTALETKARMVAA